MRKTNSAYEEKLIKACVKENSKAQEELYKHFYGYAMGISLRYTQRREEAVEILNDSFFKAFTKIRQYESGRSFKSWLARIVVNTAIDQYRRNKKHENHVDISTLKDYHYDSDLISSLAAEDILRLVQKLPEAYRMTFNLYVIEGYSHEEISKELGIPLGTSRSHLSRAKVKLREMITKQFGISYANSLR